MPPAVSPAPAPEPAEALGPEAQHVALHGHGLERPRPAGQLHYSAPSDSGGIEEREISGGATAVLTDDQLATTPRNAPCPCGSGKKFKMCHGKRR